MVNLVKLKELIKKQGVTQVFICRALNKNTYFMNDLWNGKTSLKPAEVKIVADILHTTPEYLTDQTDDPGIKKETAVTDDLDREILELFSTLSPEQKIRFLDLLKSLKPPTA